MLDVPEWVPGDGPLLDGGDGGSDGSSDRQGDFADRMYEGYRLALTGGLVDPLTGESGVVDATDGDAGTDPYTDTADPSIPEDEVVNTSFAHLFLEGTQEGADQATDTAGDVVDDATDAVLPPWFNWVLENLDWVLLALGVLALAFLARPYVGLADSVAG